MVLIGLVIIVVLLGLRVGFKTDPFNIMGAIGTWSIGALLSVIVLGMLSWHSYEQEHEYEVDDIITLDRGIAVNTDSGGMYVRHSVTNIHDRCDEPTLTEIKSKSYDYLLFFSVTTDTKYELCLPGSDGS